MRSRAWFCCSEWNDYYKLQAEEWVKRLVVWTIGQFGTFRCSFVTDRDFWHDLILAQCHTCSQSLRAILCHYDVCRQHIWNALKCVCLGSSEGVGRAWGRRALPFNLSCRSAWDRSGWVSSHGSGSWFPPLDALAALTIGCSTCGWCKRSWRHQIPEGWMGNMPAFVEEVARCEGFDSF